MTPNSNVASIVAAAFYAIWNIFTDFIIPQPRIPIWWRWYYWACPVAWTLYGLVASQFGEYTTTMDDGTMVNDFLRSWFGFRHDFLPVVAVMVMVFTVLFASIFTFSIKVFNFQRR